MGSNTFTATNAFTAPVHISDETPATSRHTGALVIRGGVAVGGDIFCQHLFTLSDERLKQDIQLLPDALESVCNLNGCVFRWNHHMPSSLADRPCVGVIAQDVQRHAPLATIQDPQTGLVAVDYNCLVP